MEKKTSEEDEKEFYENKHMVKKKNSEVDEKEFYENTLNKFQNENLTLLFGTYRTDTLPVVSPI